MKQFLNLFLLPHLSLLLLLLKIMLLKTGSLKFRLLSFVGTKPFRKLIMVFAMGSFVDRYHEHRGREEAEDRLA